MKIAQKSKSPMTIGAISLASFLLLAPCVFADLDPELQKTAIKNDSGFFVGGGLRLGQTYSSESSTPGIATMVTAEPGYVTRRDSWGRVEMSLELAGGVLDYRAKGNGNGKVRFDIPFAAMARLGYGWSLGDGIFSIVRVGAGPAISEYSAVVSEGKLTSSDPTTGMGFQLGWDVLSAVGSNLDVLGGIGWTHYAFDVGSGSLNGRSVEINKPVNLNTYQLNVGMRLTF